MEYSIKKSQSKYFVEYQVFEVDGHNKELICTCYCKEDAKRISEALTMLDEYGW